MVAMMVWSEAFRHNYQVFRGRMRGKDLAEVRRCAGICRMGHFGLVAVVIEAARQGDRDGC